MYRYASFFLLFALLISCDSTSFKNDKELVEYLKNPQNGYFQEKNINGYEFSLLYRPTDLLVHQELNGSLDDQQIMQLRDKYSKYLYFKLSMSYNGQEILSGLASDRAQFGAMVNQLAFGMDQKVHLFTEKKDTIELADFIYPRMYGMSRSTDILFVFPKQEAIESEYLNFTVEDLDLYTGEVKFKINTDKIKNQPQINF